MPPAPSRLTIRSLSGPGELDLFRRLSYVLDHEPAATAAVLPAGAERPEYGRFVPPDWHEDPVVRDAVEARIRVMEETGARMPVERLRLEGRAGTPVPEDSGRHGYIDDLLAEGTRVPAAEGVDRIRAATDLGNVPMAKSFERLGYINFERAFTMVRDAEKSKARG